MGVPEDLVEGGTAGLCLSVCLEASPFLAVWLEAASVPCVFTEATSCSFVEVTSPYFFLKSDVGVPSFHLDTPRSTSSCFLPAGGTLSLASSLWRPGTGLENPEESTESVEEEEGTPLPFHPPDSDSENVLSLFFDPLWRLLRVVVLREEEEEDKLLLRKGDVYPAGDADEELPSGLVLRVDESGDSDLKAVEEEVTGGRDLVGRSSGLPLTLLLVGASLSALIPVVLSRVLMVGKL